MNQQPIAAFGPAVHPSPIFGQPTIPQSRPTSVGFSNQPTTIFFGTQVPAPQQPTDLASIFQAISLQPPQDNNFYMDTGASFHMSFNQGNMSSLSPCNSKSIMVGNGAILPVSHISHTFLPSYQNKFFLNDVLVSNHIVKNLISLRKFTIDNCVSVSFDPFGFSVKDLNSGTLLQRCDSVGDLYPFLPTRTSSVPAKALVAVSLPTWHRCLGHPGSSVLRFLHSRNFISSNSNKIPTCHACQVGKHCRLPFTSSTTKTSHVFELIHSDLWTSPVTS